MVPLNPPCFKSSPSLILILVLRPGSGLAHLFQCTDLAAGDVRVLLGRGPQSSDKQIHTVFVLGQQGGRRLVVLPQDEVHELGLGPQQGGGVWAALLQEAIQDRKQSSQDGLRGEEEIRVKEAVCLDQVQTWGCGLALTCPLTWLNARSRTAAAYDGQQGA